MIHETSKKQSPTAISTGTDHKSLRLSANYGATLDIKKLLTEKVPMDLLELMFSVDLRATGLIFKSLIYRDSLFPGVRVPARTPHPLHNWRDSPSVFAKSLIYNYSLFPVIAITGNSDSGGMVGKSAFRLYAFP